ncbi:ABC transporter ATP-binding protein [Shouchella sp. JSM 1781072]|uniref:ABC transporter ATP-binding protein n=1 Tax=Bacillaceae TaxID=186817 RepID=UPI0020D1BBDE|nr:ABC transporter ATP-binding protein [Alkalihalobacillus sp. LMS6]UTR07614.1 ABC transporter ATP-binding protein [Alkalihalobacillus sp. LMS6]
MTIEVNALTKEGRIKDITFQIATNQITALIGENGAGKTTLLHLIAGNLQPSSGSVQFSGYLEKDIRSTIGFLPQFPAFPLWMTGLEYLTYIGRLFGFTKKQAYEKALTLLQIVRLNANDRQRIETYSGGMKQRLGIAQALIGDPGILLLDEPVSALDPIGRTEVMELLLQLKKGRSILYSTHILHDAEQISDAYVLMHKGELISAETITSFTNQNESILEIETVDHEQLSKRIAQCYPQWIVHKNLNVLEIIPKNENERADLAVLTLLTDGHYKFQAIRKRKKTLVDVFGEAVRG